MRDLASLAKRFSEIFAEHAAFDPVYQDAVNKCEAEIARRIGVLPHWGFRTEAEAEAYRRQRALVWNEMGLDALDKKSDEIYSRLDPIVAAIASIPASDLDGIAAKANAVGSAFPGLWTTPVNDLDYEKGLLRDLIENICAVAKTELAVKVLPLDRSGLN